MASFNWFLDVSVLLLIFGLSASVVVLLPVSRITSSALLSLAGLCSLLVGYTSLARFGGVRPADAFTLYFLWAAAGAYIIGSGPSVRERAWDAGTVALGSLSAYFDNFTLRIVLLQGAYLCWFVGSFKGSDGRQYFPFLTATVLSTLAITAGFLMDGLFRLRLDETGLAKAAVGTTVVGYAIRLGLSPFHIWLRPYPEEGRALLWFLALAPATTGLLIDHTQVSVAWASQAMSLKEWLMGLGLGSATLAFLLSLALQGKAKALLISIGLWALPCAALSMPAGGVALSAGLGLVAGLTAWWLFTEPGTGVLAVFSAPVYPLLPGMGLLAVLGVLAASNPALLALGISTFSFYVLATSRSVELQPSITPRGLALAALLGASGLAFPWLLALLVRGSP